MARTTKELGLSSSQLLTITRAVNQAFLISGAGAQEAAAAVMQLGQGFAAGRLSGDELNSVLEQAPRLAEAIATGMGKTVGELKKLGSEGVLTTKKVAQALLTESGNIEQEFGKLDKTIGEGFVGLGNEVTRFIGTVNIAMGGSDKFGDVIGDLATSIGELTESLQKLNTSELAELADTIKLIMTIAGGGYAAKKVGGWIGATALGARMGRFGGLLGTAGGAALAGGYYAYNNYDPTMFSTGSLDALNPKSGALGSPGYSPQMRFPFTGPRKAQRSNIGTSDPSPFPTPGKGIGRLSSGVLADSELGQTSASGTCIRSI